MNCEGSRDPDALRKLLEKLMIVIIECLHPIILKLVDDNSQEQGITVAQFDKYLSVEPTRS